MCGIYGWQWRKDKMPSQCQRLILASMLGVYNDMRGGDSWGWYSPMTRTFNKGMGEIAPDARFAAFHDSMLAHTRKATVGAKTIDNAHPWLIGDIIGAHNGSVYNHAELNPEREVDSMHIFHKLNKEESLAGLRGTGSIEWIDKRVSEDMIHLCRTSTTSDLAVVETDHGVVWSSSTSSLKTAMTAAGFKFGTIGDIRSEHVAIVLSGRILLTDRKMKFDQKDYPTSPVYGSQYSFRGSWSEPKREKEEVVVSGFTKSVRKTIGKQVRVLGAGEVAYVCRSCYRRLDQQQRCPRGHAEGVMEIKDLPTGPVANVVNLK